MEGVTPLLALVVPVIVAGLWAKHKGLEHILIHYRWVFVCLFLMPTSLVYDSYMYMRCWFIFRMNTAPEKHDEKVREVQRQVRNWNDAGRKERMCTARPAWMAVSLRQGKYKHTLHRVSVNLVDVLKVDTERRVVRVEPLVSMGQLSATLVPLSWTVPIVPELDDLTVGGLIMGVGIETSSHKYGLMQHVCESFELVLADGSIATCSKDSNPDLFYAVPWSHGTLGFLVSAEIQIVPAKKYVRIEYLPVHSFEDMVAKFSTEMVKTDTNDFVEALQYTFSEAVVMVGTMTDEAEADKINCIGNYYKPWFYKHVEGFLHSGAAIEYIPLRDYYHRHTRGLFWQMQDIVPFGNNPLFRYVFGAMMPPKISLLKLTQGETIRRMYEQHQFIQDMLVPVDKLAESLRYIHNEVAIYPLWLCPFKLPDNPGMVHPKGDGTEFYVDIGVYGEPKTEVYHNVVTTRSIEEFVIRSNGFQMLYADCYLTREEFRKMFDHSLYDRMRRELDCEAAFPEVYDKVNHKARI